MLEKESAMRRKEHALNEAAFRRLEEKIKQTYAHGQYVALLGGEIVADASQFDELQEKLKLAGKNPRHAFIVQAGHPYPRHAVIFLRDEMNRVLA
jgi:hypothetical protein